MAIIPSVIVKKAFKRSFCGYDIENVDDYLDEIILGYERLHRENVLLKNQNTALAESSLSFQDKISELSKNLKRYESLENSIQSALVNAEKMGEDIRKTAIEKAESIEEEARQKANEILSFAKLEKKMLLSDIYSEGAPGLRI